MPGASYNNVYEILGITLIVDHIDPLCDKLFHRIVSNKDHRLNSLLPPLYIRIQGIIYETIAFTIYHMSAPIGQRTLLYLQWPPSKSNFIGKFLIVERVTIIVSYFPNNIS